MTHPTAFLRYGPRGPGFGRAAFARFTRSSISHNRVWMGGASIQEPALVGLVAPSQGS